MTFTFLLFSFFSSLVTDLSVLEADSNTTISTIYDDYMVFVFKNISTLVIVPQRPLSTTTALLPHATISDIVLSDEEVAIFSIILSVFTLNNFIYFYILLQTFRMAIYNPIYMHCI